MECDKKCECGCGELIHDRNKNGPIRYKHGHNHKGKCNYWSMKDNIKTRQSRNRAMKILTALGINKCQIKNHDCKGKLESHHIDKNPFNNDINNLVLLCQSHHELTHKRNISIEELKNLKLEYYEDKWCRRYAMR